MLGKTLVRSRFRPLLLHIVVLLFVPLLLASPCGAELLELVDLISHPHYYDRKEVVVMGKVSRVQLVTDQQGQQAFQFFLEDGFGTLKVTSKAEVQEGDQIIVEGTFTRRRQAGRITVYNEVKATSVRPLNELHPDLVG